jgi:myosin heavy subunit
LAGKGGILEILNAQSSAIQPSEDKFVRDLAKDFKLHGFFPEVHRKDARDSFKVLHFAGPVHYTVKGWLLKNSDPLPETAGAVFGAGSQLPLVRKLFADELKSEEAAAAGRGASKSSKKDTVAAAFVRSMRSLTTELSQTKCNFIRCIKPNALMRAGLFHRAYVVDQVPPM